MKILHIPNYYKPHIGGIEQTAEDIVNALRDENDQRVICFKDAKKTVTDDVDGISVTRVSCAIKFRSQSIALSYKKELKKMFREFNPDTVVFHYPNPFVAHCLLKVIKKYPETKLIVWWHTDIVKQKFLGKFFNGQNRRILDRANKVIATSQNYVDGSKWLTEYRDKVSVIPSCVSIKDVNIEMVDNIIKRIKEDNKDKKIIFSLGRHVEYKGFKYLIDATEYLPNDYVIYIGGAGMMTPELQKQAGDNFKIIFTGILSDEEVEAYYNACDLFAFPSITKNEAFGLALAEALMHGKPAVTFNIPGSGVNYVNLASVTGLEVPNGDSKLFAEAIVEILSNEELYLKFSNNAVERSKLFSKDSFSKLVKKEINI